MPSAAGVLTPRASRATRLGGAFKQLRVLLKHKLVHHENTRYDGYRLTPLGYDYLAIHALVARGALTGVGRKVGVGKESDVYEARFFAADALLYSQSHVFHR